MVHPKLRTSARTLLRDERADSASSPVSASYPAFGFARTDRAGDTLVPDSAFGQVSVAAASPVVGGFPKTITADELALRATPLIVAPDATFSDDDGDLAGAVLQWIVPVSDKASLHVGGDGPGQIGLAPSTENPGNSHFFTLTYGGTAVGSGLVSDNVFRVTFNPAATAGAVQETIRNLAVSFTTTAPAASHDLLLKFSDAAGHQLPVVPGEDPSFTRPTGSLAPSYTFLSYPESTTYFGSVPALADLDGDGDLDQPFGKDDGTIGYLENVARAGAVPAFVQRGGTANPFNGFDVGEAARMSFGDLDGDGDLDVVIASYAGVIRLFRNDGTATAPAFVAVAANPFAAINVGSAAFPALGDLDGDGDLDLAVTVAVSRTGDNGLHYFENIGGASAPSFVERAGSASPLPFAPSVSTSPAFVDFDYDGDLDLAFQSGGYLAYLRNNGSPTAPNFESVGRFDGVGDGSLRYFAVADLDRDGEFDVVGAGLFLKGVAFHGVQTILNVNLYNDAPVLTGFPPSVSYAEGQTWTPLSPAAVVAESDSQFIGVSLRVSGLLASDAVKVSASLLSYYNATVTGGAGSDLLLSFNSVTPASVVSQFLQSLTYESLDKNPVASHSLSLTLTDRGGASTSATLALNITPRNDVPTLNDLAPSVTIVVNQTHRAPQLIDPDVTVRDAESNFAGGVLRVAGLLGEDRVDLRSDGTGPGQVGVTGTTVTYGGTAVGTLAGGTGATFSVTFNTAATAASVEAVAEHLTYANASDTPTVSRVLQVSLTDAGSAGLEGQSNYVNLGDPFNLLHNFDGHGNSLPAFADLDGDGVKELVVAAASLYLGVGARDPVTGYFVDASPAIASAVRAVPFNGNLGTSLTFVDLDGDGDQDVVSGDQYGTFRYFQNTGTGAAPSFTQRFGAQDPTAGLYVGSTPNSNSASVPAFADLDGDGDQDMISGSQRGPLSYFENVGTATAPAFVKRAGSANPLDSLALGTHTTPAVVDYDGDGDVDLVVGQADGTFRYFENVGSRTAPQFVERTGAANPFNRLDAGDYSAPALIDIDGDGDLDLVSGTSAGITVFSNETVPRHAVTVNVTPVAVLNGTEGDDVLTADDGATRLLGLGGNDILTGGAGDDLLIGGSGADTLTGGRGADTFRGTDRELNGDTITDLAIGDRISISNWSYASPWFDFARAGDKLVFTDGSGALIVGTSSLRLTVTPSAEGGVDFIAANHYAGLSDFDGDGHSDILWQNRDGAVSAWSAYGNARVQQLVAPRSYADVDPSWHVVETFDMNGDGRSDILWRKTDGTVAAWHARATTNGSLGFDGSSYLAASPGAAWKIAGVGDLGGDGKDDILWRNDDGSISAWSSTGGGFNQNSYFHASVGAGWKVEGLGDFDGDGRADILWRELGGALSIWRSNGFGFDENSYFDASVPTASGWHVAGLGDVNGDGHEDVLWRNDDGAFSVWQSTGAGGFAKGTYNAQVAIDWHVAQVGDFNADGRADILWQNSAGAISIWQSNGGGFDQNVLYDAGPGTSWQIQAHDTFF